jgi:hypothetical protein
MPHDVSVNSHYNYCYVTKTQEKADFETACNGYLKVIVK